MYVNIKHKFKSLCLNLQSGLKKHNSPHFHQNCSNGSIQKENQLRGSCLSITEEPCDYVRDVATCLP